MGTRSRVNIIEDGKILVSIYRQFDGYPSGMGVDLAEFLKPMKVINGIGLNDKTGSTANGMGCLAAQLIGYLKEGIGNVYIRNTGPKSHGEQYIYNIREKSGKLYMDVLSGSVTFFGCPGDAEEEMIKLFSGTAAEFDPEACETAQEELMG